MKVFSYSIPNCLQILLISVYTKTSHEKSLKRLTNSQIRTEYCGARRCCFTCDDA